MTEVTHPSEGIYLSKFMAGVASTILAAALIGSFTNLWYLNTKAIKFDNHIATVESPTATLPGALSKAEWDLERKIIMSELRGINTKLDELKQDVKDME